jgi:hypothetical protein
VRPCRDGARSGPEYCPHANFRKLKFEFKFKFKSFRNVGSCPRSFFCSFAFDGLPPTHHLSFPPPSLLPSLTLSSLTADEIGSWRPPRAQHPRWRQER